MRLIEKAEDLVEGEFYWFAAVIPEVEEPSFTDIVRCDSYHGHKYMTQNRIWCTEHNDQFTGEYVAYGPIPKPFTGKFIKYGLISE